MVIKPLLSQKQRAESFPDHLPVWSTCVHMLLDLSLGFFPFEKCFQSHFGARLYRFPQTKALNEEKMFWNLTAVVKGKCKCNIKRAENSDKQPNFPQGGTEIFLSFEALSCNTLSRSSGCHLTPDSSHMRSNLNIEQLIKFWLHVGLWKLFKMLLFQQ